MTIVRFALAALVLGASQAPAFAFPGSGGRTGDNSVEIRLAQPVASSALTEGRQAAIVAADTTAAEAYVVGRNFNESHSR